MVTNEIFTDEESQANIEDKATNTVAPNSRVLRMKQGNIVSINQFPFSPEMFRMCDEMELVETKLVYAYDENNKAIPDKIDAVTYTCVDGKNWYNFKIPNQTKAVISQEEIDRREQENNPVYVRIPLNKIVFKSYQNMGDRGILRLSLQIPYIELL